MTMARSPLPWYPMARAMPTKFALSPARFDTTPASGRLVLGYNSLPGVAAGLALTLSLVGCVVETARVAYATGVVVTEPPPGVAETVGVAPVPGYIWTR